MIKSEVYATALAKAKVAFNAKNDSELAKALGLDRSAISVAHKKGTAPVRHIVDACIDNNVSIDHIFGIKPKSCAQ